MAKDVTTRGRVRGSVYRGLAPIAARLAVA